MDDPTHTRLTDHTAYMECLIGMVPAHFFLPANREAIAKKFAKYTGKVPSVPKHERKLQGAERKKARLDPAQHKTKLELEREMAEEKEGDDDSQDEDDVGSLTPSKDDASDVEGNEGGADEGERPHARGGASVKHPPLLAGPQLGPDGQPQTVEQLHQRLSEKLQQLRSGRGGTTKDAAQRAAEREKAQAKHKSKARPSKGAGDRHDPTSERAAAGRGDGGGKGGGSGGQLEFNKLAEGKKKRKKSTEELLAEAEETAKRRREATSEEALAENWGRALQKADGEKLKDDPALLRKALKRQERAKKKSSKAWKDRVKTVAKSMKERQEKRTQNLKERMTKGKNRAKKLKERAGKRS
jgi:hypothetical protein